ncbi:hypothetical protein NBO_562g0001 [Nosema bombycis CQ1]|uniref:Uncharacterized protein n=1 Tax=Nosema bombycis (strain CQ1 / CVCC 102059) TaxID=578461 RepID=R0MDB3_NOSB1|nr:hypothetical protein NBO_562g0001 [Nosema bombycis CQ1]|eukprot:EOB12065.1 hypothetical protein NBO_562g0001 [Nosema bombycis CQ1]
MKLQPEANTETTSETIILANGIADKVDEKTNLTGILTLTKKLEKLEFYILDQLPFKEIIGTETLEELNCQITFRDKGVHIERTNQDESFNPNDEIHNKIALNYLSSEYFISNLTALQSKNSNLGCINT